MNGYQRRVQAEADAHVKRAENILGSLENGGHGKDDLATVISAVMALTYATLAVAQFTDLTAGAGIS